MLKFIHAADFHLDAPFRSLPPELAAQKRQEQRALLGRLTQYCREERADFLLLAGDLFDAQAQYRETLEAVLAAMEEIAIPIFISPGNHDYVHSASRYVSTVFPSNVHIFRELSIQAVPLVEKNTVIYGNAFCAPTSNAHPLADFRAPQDGRYHIAVLHGDVDMPASQYAPIMQTEIAQSGLHYLALGHVHRRTELQWAGASAYAYAGCAAGRGFDETGVKGCYALTLDEDGISARFLPLGGCRYEHLRLAAYEGIDWGAQAQALLHEQGITPRDFVRLTLTGSDAGGMDEARLYELLSPLAARLELRDERRAPQDLWARLGEDSLTGQFLRNLYQLYDSASDEQARAQIVLAARYGLAALENGEEVRL